MKTKAPATKMVTIECFSLNIRTPESKKNRAGWLPPQLQDKDEQSLPSSSSAIEDA